MPVLNRSVELSVKLDVSVTDLLGVKVLERMKEGVSVPVLPSPPPSPEPLPEPEPEPDSGALIHLYALIWIGSAEFIP